MMPNFIKTGSSTKYTVGGEFELKLHELCAHVLNDKFRVYKKYQLYVDTGRSAILIALLDILKKGGRKEAWLPYYCCESVIIPFRQLGFKISFYSQGEELNKFDYLKINSGAVFLYIHYFGIKNVAITKWLNSFVDSSRNFYVIEDRVQAVLNCDVCDVCDYVITSYRKFFSLPDGAVVACNHPIEVELLEPDEEFISKKVIAKLLKGMGVDFEYFSPLLTEAERKLELDIRPRVMSWFSTEFAKKINLLKISVKRRKNWNYCAKLISLTRTFDNRLRLLFKALNDDEVPLGFPVIINDGHRDALWNYLATQRIYCPIHWEIRSRGDQKQWDKEIKLSSSILTLPIDQRVSERKLEYLIEKIKCYFEKQK